MSFNEDLIDRMNAVMHDDVVAYGEGSDRVERTMLDLAQLMTGEDRQELKKRLRIGDLPENIMPMPVSVSDMLEANEPTPKLEALAKRASPWGSTTKNS